MARRLAWWRWMLAALGAAGTASAADLGFRVPPGFEVSLVADDRLVQDLNSITCDAQGRPVVSGPRFIKTLHDDDGDGQADRTTLYYSGPAGGARGLCFDGPDLVCTGDNAVLRLRDIDGDGVADGKAEIWAPLKNPDHGANGVVRGPDGFFYVICGNDAGVDARLAQRAGSPVTQPSCGAILRFSPEGSHPDILADGFRNPYDFDFTAGGQMLTVDADGERDHHLPWYAPNRLFDVGLGQHHGWVLQGWTQSWSRPASFPDSGRRVVELGRGSPTGVKVYRHTQFPPRYRDGVFSLCWTFGRVYFLPLARAGATYDGKLERFMETTGTVGFAPVDLTVSPAGDLLVAIGGRGTRGGVYRVRYVGGDSSPPTPPRSNLDRVLRAPEPLASWSRAQWAPEARRLGAEPFVQAAVANDRSTAERVRAVEVLTELYGGVSLQTGEQAAALGDADLLARVAWSLGRRPEGRDVRPFLAALTHRAEPIVARAAWEAMLSLPPNDKPFDPAPAWLAAADSPDRVLRGAMLALAARQPEAFPSLPVDASPRARLAALTVARPSPQDAADVQAANVETCLRVLENPAATGDRIEALRLLHFQFGDLKLMPSAPEVYCGYAFRELDRVAPAVRSEAARRVAARFPSGDAELDRELARFVGALEIEAPEFLHRLTRRLTADSPLLDDVHFLIVASRVPGARSIEVTRPTAQALLRLHAKLDAGGRHPSRNWPLRVGETWRELCRRDAALSEALVAAPLFGHPEHDLFVESLTGELQTRAVRRLLGALLAAGDDEAWSSGFVRLLAALPDAEILPVLRPRWDEPGLSDAITLVLARRPQEADRARYVAGLGSVQPQVVERSAAALLQLAVAAQPIECAAAVAAHRQACQAKEYAGPRAALEKLLAHWSGLPAVEKEGDDLPSLSRRWQEWLAARHPAEARRLAAFGVAEPAAFKTRIAGLPWEAGDARRGQAVFEKKACHRCHLGAARLGPDLAGVTGRFSREDLFLHIVDPHRDVAPPYRTRLIVTRSGMVVHGVAVYESPESTIVQTGPDTTIRVAGDEVQSVTTSRQSLMPTGLLDQLTDSDLADLYAYLKTLTAKPSGN